MKTHTSAHIFVKKRPIIYLSTFFSPLQCFAEIHMREGRLAEFSAEKNLIQKLMIATLASRIPIEPLRG